MINFVKKLRRRHFKWWICLKTNAHIVTRQQSFYLGNETQYNTRKLLLERILMVIASHKVHTISLFVANRNLKILHISFYILQPFIRSNA